MIDTISNILFSEDIFYIVGAFIGALLAVFLKKRFIIEPRTKREEADYEKMSSAEKTQFDKTIKIRSFMESKIFPLLSIITFIIIIFIMWPELLK